ncbi:MAG: hypothetical protein ACI9QL_004189 [Candidatus Omnitrophota bacterium]
MVEDDEAGTVELRPPPSLPYLDSGRWTNGKYVLFNFPINMLPMISIFTDILDIEGPESYGNLLEYDLNGFNSVLHQLLLVDRHDC